MVNALTHGNEICGAIALDRLLRRGVRPRAARSRSLRQRRSLPALRSAQPLRHALRRRGLQPRLDAGHARRPARQRRAAPRARAAPFVEAADYLLDIHSMLEPSPPVMICGPLEKGIRMAFDVGVPEHIVSDTGHANGTRMRDYGGFGDAASPKNALLVECGQHWERAAEQVAWQTVALPAPPRRGGRGARRARDRGAVPRRS
jgi:hypothetical protein